MTQVTIRFNAPPHHVFRCGDLELAGGKTARVPADEGELLAERNPGDIEIVGPRARGKSTETTDAASAAEPKEEE